MLSCAARFAAAQDIRYFERNGITYREVMGNGGASPILQNPQCLPTVYRPQVYVETRQVLRSYWLPITEYRWEMRWVNRWNPFAEPYQELRYVPYTRWEYRTEVVDMPVTCQRWVAEPIAGSTPANAAAVYPNPSVVAVAGLPTPYAPRGGFGGQGTGLQGAGAISSSSTSSDAVLSGAGSVAPWEPTVASRLPLRAASEPTASRMVPVRVPAWPSAVGIGGIQRFED